MDITCRYTNIEGNIYFAHKSLSPVPHRLPCLLGIQAHWSCCLSNLQEPSSPPHKLELQLLSKDNFLHHCIHIYTFGFLYAFCFSK